MYTICEQNDLSNMKYDCIYFMVVLKVVSLQSISMRLWPYKPSLTLLAGTMSQHRPII